MVNSGSAEDGFVEGLGMKEMMKMLTFGADKVFEADGRAPSDAELDAIIDRTVGAAGCIALPCCSIAAADCIALPCCSIAAAVASHRGPPRRPSVSQVRSPPRKALRFTG
jgi:hypothetical protein